jgi:anti-sigma-K factor RskA
VSIEPGATLRRPPKRDGGVGSLPASMRMRQSLAEFEAAFREEAAESVERRERLRKHAVQRTRIRRVERQRQQGKLRFTLLTLSIVVTAVIVTIVMFETLALLAG